MITVHISVHVKPEFIEEFIRATLENARQSLQEPGVVHFDVLQQDSDPSRFLLMEGYKDESAPARHKETTHYQIWKDAVAGMMSEPRSSVRYRVLSVALPRT